MSWPPRDNSSGPPIYRPSGLVSSEATSTEQQQQQQTQDRPRLPPLSTLLAASSSHRATPTSSTSSSPKPSYLNYGFSSSTPTQGSHTATTSASSQTSPNLDRYPTADTYYRRPPPPVQPQRSSSASLAINLPPLTSLSLRPRGSSRSPPLSSTSTTQREQLQPPRLPSTSYATTRRPSHGQLEPSTSSSISATGAGFGPIRRRVTSSVPMSGPYRRHSPVYDQDYFNTVWDIYTYACRVNDETSPRDQQSYPRITSGDIQGLVYHLHSELDRLDRRDSRLSYQLAQDAGLTKTRQPSTSSSSSSFQHRTASSRNISGEHHEDKRTPSDDMEMSSSSGSFTSPTISIYASGLPAAYAHSESSSTHHRHRRLSAGRSPQHSFTSPPYQQQHQQASTSASTSTTLPPPKRVRKRKDETDQSCLCCSATETPEWRKGPTGPRTLCNACGLLFAKQCRKKELEAQQRGERPRGSRPPGPEIMSAEERQTSLAELRIAVNARANASPPM